MSIAKTEGFVSLPQWGKVAGVCLTDEVLLSVCANRQMLAKLFYKLLIHRKRSPFPHKGRLLSRNFSATDGNENIIFK